MESSPGWRAHAFENAVKYLLRFPRAPSLAGYTGCPTACFHVLNWSGPGTVTPNWWWSGDRTIPQEEGVQNPGSATQDGCSQTGGSPQPLWALLLPRGHFSACICPWQYSGLVSSTNRASMASHFQSSRFVYHFPKMEALTCALGKERMGGRVLLHETERKTKEPRDPLSPATNLPFAH